MNIEALTSRIGSFSNLEKYKLGVCMCQETRCSHYSFHTHHIKPKSLYPSLADDWRNQVEVPDILHWALHYWLLEHYKESGDQNAAYKMRDTPAGVANYINKFLEKKESLHIDFNANKDDILKECERLLAEFASIWKWYKSFETKFKEERSRTLQLDGASRDGSKYKVKLWASSKYKDVVSLLPLTFAKDDTKYVWYNLLKKDFTDFLEKAKSSNFLVILNLTQESRIEKLGLSEVHFDNTDSLVSRFGDTIKFRSAFQDQLKDFHTDVTRKFACQTSSDISPECGFVDRIVKKATTLDNDEELTDEIKRSNCEA